MLVDKKTGALTFQRPDGTVITRERADQPAEIKEVTISDAPTYEVKQTFTLSRDESLYGLGQYNDRYMDYRGKQVLLVQTNIGIVVPVPRLHEALRHHVGHLFEERSSRTTRTARRSGPKARPPAWTTTSSPRDDHGRRDRRLPAASRARRRCFRRRRSACS